jgi:hypothetical protein
MTLNAAVAARPCREMVRAAPAPAAVTAAAGPASSRVARATAALATLTGRAKAVHPRPEAAPVSPEADLALLAPVAPAPAWVRARASAPALLEGQAHGQALARDPAPPGLARYLAAVPTRPTGRLPRRRLTAPVPVAPAAVLAAVVG